MGIFKADYKEMLLIIGRLDEILNKLTEELELLKEALLRLDITWKGDANISFMAAMFKDIERIRAITDNLVNFSESLKRGLRLYQENEERVEKRIMEARI
ncbi:MAG: hypothetical protein K5931_11115 [Lachnospiraceae bacterium]|nr:hypothetical protein [Lachnospiraceae bacterium]